MTPLYTLHDDHIYTFVHPFIPIYTPHITYIYTICIPNVKKHTSNHPLNTLYAFLYTHHYMGGRYRKPYTCPVPDGASLPMIAREDLIRGLRALMDAPRANLREPEAGYALAGFTVKAKSLFNKVRAGGKEERRACDGLGCLRHKVICSRLLPFSPSPLVDKLRRQCPGFVYSTDLGPEGQQHAATFARTWPDSLSPAAAESDLGFRSQVDITYFSLYYAITGL